MLQGGPWFINGYIIGMDAWSPGFDPTSLKDLSSAVWIRLPQLPLMCWDRANIARIATRVGLPLWIDSATNEWGRMVYACVCVRIILSKPLPGGVSVTSSFLNFFQPVEYEGLASMCSRCGCIGHLEGTCKENVPPPGAARPPHTAPVPPETILARDTPLPPVPTLGVPLGAGPWCIIKHRRQRRLPKALTPHPHPPVAPTTRQDGPPLTRARNFPPRTTIEEQQPHNLFPLVDDLLPSAPDSSFGLNNGDVFIPPPMDILIPAEKGTMEIDENLHTNGMGSGLELVTNNLDGSSFAPRAHHSSAARELAMLGQVDIVSHKRTKREETFMAGTYPLQGVHDEYNSVECSGRPEAKGGPPYPGHYIAVRSVFHWAF